MSDKNPYEILKVTENASFEEIQAAKDRISQEYQKNNQAVEEVETAYDAIIMDRLRLRQEGKIKVPERIRFPERSVQIPTTNNKSITEKNAPSWLQQLSDNPSQKEVLISTAIFFGLGIVSAVSLNNSNIGFVTFLLGVGTNSCLYIINSKEKRFGRSLLITLLSLIGGIGIGTWVSEMLRTNGLIIAPEQVASALTFGLFWLSSCFIR